MSASPGPGRDLGAALGPLRVLLMVVRGSWGDLGGPRAPETIYGSMLDAGLLSSTYPFPLAAIVEVGILNEAALFPQP